MKLIVIGFIFGWVKYDWLSFGGILLVERLVRGINWLKFWWDVIG